MKNRIRELRNGYGVTQRALADYLGVAQNTLSYWEQGKYDIDNLSLQKIADYFKCSIDFILYREPGEISPVNDDFISLLLSEKEKKINNCV